MAERLPALVRRAAGILGQTAFAGTVTAALLFVTLVPAIVTMIVESSRPPLVIAQAVFIAVTGAVLVYRAVTVRNFSVAWAMFWMWVYVFLGLAPMYQLAADTFPWLGEFDDDTVQSGQRIVIVGCLVLLTVAAWVRRRREFRDYSAVGNPANVQGQLIARVIWVSLSLYAAVAIFYISIMGASLFQGKWNLQTQLIANEDIPGAGTAFFLSTAGAIVLPAAAIVARRNGVAVPIPLLILSTVLAFVVTNPLTGSRFLTGSMLLAVLGALLVGKPLLRLMPAGVGTALITIFPSLDVWRGDGTGANSVVLAMPSKALVTFDFDSFEMLLREVSVQGPIPPDLPNRWDLLVAPLVRWIPGVSDSFQGIFTSRVVGELTGMSYTNVSMPLWGEAHFVGGLAGVIIVFAALGIVLALIRPPSVPSALLSPSRTRLILDAPIAALLIIVLRGSLYEVLGYLLFAILFGATVWLAAFIDNRGPQVPTHPAPIRAQIPRTVAFYLPQFHAIPENDAWWGEGFTEWVNVARAQPQFDEHVHPRRPTELGTYDLTSVSVMHAQAALAKEYDIDAFCFYFYSFGGKRLLEKPLDNYLKEGPDFPFCISWANESWTRRWDGKEHESLIAQEYEATTAIDVFDSFLPYLRDGRYLRVDGAAVIVVHRADHLPAGSAYADAWRARARTLGVGDLHIVAAETNPGIHPSAFGFDAVCEFPPVGSNTLNAVRPLAPRRLNPEFRGRIMSYPRLVKSFIRRSEPSFVRYRGVAPGWDNTARRQNAATIYAESSPFEYRRWLHHAREVERLLRGSDGLVFINAWNEWAEGAYLEPDEVSGRTYLEMTRLAIHEQPPIPERLRSGFGGVAWLHSMALVGIGTGLQYFRRARTCVLRSLRRQ